MPITRFQQDPDAPFGRGNFFDDQGRATYAFDPDTAKRFIDTTPGAGAQSPPAQPDRRIAGPVVPGSLPDGFEPVAPVQTGLPPAEDLADKVNQVTPPPVQQAEPAAPGPAQSLVDKVNQVTPAPRAGGLQVASRTVSSRSPQRTVQRGLDTTEARASNEAAAASATESVESATAQRVAGITKRRQAEASAAATGFFQAGGEAEQQRRRKKAADDQALALEMQSDPRVDPGRFLNNMGAGRKIILVLMGALGDAFQAATGTGGETTSDVVVGALSSQIDRDIAAQKADIAAGRAQRTNLVEMFRQRGFEAGRAETAARAHMLAMAERFASANSSMFGETAEAQARGQELVGSIQREKDQTNAQLLLQEQDRESITEGGSTTTTTSSRPGAGPDPLDRAIKLAKLAKLQSESTGSKEVTSELQKVADDLDKVNKVKASFDSLISRVGLVPRNGKLQPENPDDPDLVGKGRLDAFWGAAADRLGFAGEDRAVAKAEQLFLEEYGRLQSQGAITKEELENFVGYFSATTEDQFTQNMQLAFEEFGAITQARINQLSPAAKAEFQAREQASALGGAPASLKPR